MTYSKKVLASISGGGFEHGTDYRQFIHDRTDILLNSLGDLFSDGGPYDAYVVVSGMMKPLSMKLGTLPVTHSSEVHYGVGVATPV